MKKRNRDINVFSLSAIDLFCSGMGAIMVLTVILMPYYQRPDAREILDQLAAARASAEDAAQERDAALGALAEARRENEQLSEARQEAERKERQTESIRTALEEAQVENEQLRRQNQQMQSELEQPFLVVAVSWNGKMDDVDLHITDPDGREYYYEKRRHPGSEANLEVDSEFGPGTEVWIHPAAKPGDYKVEYVYYEDREERGPVKVRGVAVYRAGRLALPDMRLRAADQSHKHHVAILRVDARGQVTVD